MSDIVLQVAKEAGLRILSMRPSRLQESFCRVRVRRLKVGTGAAAKRGWAFALLAAGRVGCDSGRSALPC